jgi:hypothetical protein
MKANYQPDSHFTLSMSNLRDEPNSEKKFLSLNRVNQLIVVTVKSGVFFAVRTESLNNI